MRLLVATRNRNKLKEIRDILADLSLDIVCAADMPHLPVVHEDGQTIRDNAIKKAVETAKMARLLTLADDTGLEVDALNGEPGVRSARFAGDDVSYHENNKKLLGLLEGVALEKRTARFRCARRHVPSRAPQREHPAAQFAGLVARKPALDLSPA